MPGFIMHLSEATLILKELNKTNDPEWQRAFMIGNLMPDTRLGKEKHTSHFWSDDHTDYIARAPQLEKFLGKYSSRLNEPMMLGYYAHLCLDERYVNHFWPTIFGFYDKDGIEEPRAAYIHHVKMHETGEEIPFERFFTEEYYYGDYNRCNQWFIDRYKLQIPIEDKTVEIHMDEVNGEDLKRVIGPMREICAQCSRGDEANTKVFHINVLNGFIEDSADAFIQIVKENHLI